MQRINYLDYYISSNQLTIKLIYLRCLRKIKSIYLGYCLSY